MSQIIPIYIPTLISDVNYNPTKVYPRLFFYNGVLECQPYYFEYKISSGSSVVRHEQMNGFPYVDHYNVVTGSFPSEGSKTLLYQNEEPVYGASPSASLYNEYWETYVNLLYNPKTRLINCSGIIPLADYFKMELNDIVSWRGNDYHLRAINDYDLTTGKCNMQLLGPIIKDTFGIVRDCDFTFEVTGPTTTTTQGPTTTSTTSTTTLGPGTTTTTTQALVNCEFWEVDNTSMTETTTWAFTDCSTGVTTLRIIQPNTVYGQCVRYAPTYVSGNTQAYRWMPGTCVEPATTTTTTTIGPTTTTAAPTTTTTTKAPIVGSCNCSEAYIYNNGSGGSMSYSYIPCGALNRVSGSLSSGGFYACITSGSLTMNGMPSSVTYYGCCNETGSQATQNCPLPTPTQQLALYSMSTPAQSGVTTNLYFTDFLGNTRTYGMTGLARTYKFVAISGSVSYNGTGTGTLTLLNLVNNATGSVSRLTNNGTTGLTGWSLQLADGGLDVYSTSTTFDVTYCVIDNTYSPYYNSGRQTFTDTGANCIPCFTTTTTTAAPTTTTAAPTTTTTTIPANYYYTIQQYNCPSCGTGPSSIGISSTPLVVGNYYGYPGDTQCYRILGQTSQTNWSVDLNYMNGFGSCNNFCTI